MAFRDLIPWSRRPQRQEPGHPLERLHSEVDRLFDHFMESFDRGPEGWAGLTSPSVDVAETEQEVTVTAELPGLDEEDLELSLKGENLVIRGEKRAEKEDKGRDYYHVERSYGTFHRAVPLPCEVDEDRAEATYKKGVLTVRLPKSAGATRHRKQIEVH